MMKTRNSFLTVAIKQVRKMLILSPTSFDFISRLKAHDICSMSIFRSHNA